MQGLDRNPLANLELLAVGRGLGDGLTVFAPNYSKLGKLLQLERLVTANEPQMTRLQSYHCRLHGPNDYNIRQHCSPFARQSRSYW